MKGQECAESADSADVEEVFFFFVEEVCNGTMVQNSLLSQHLIVHYSTSSKRVSMQENEGAQRSARAEQAVRSKQMSERSQRMSKQASK